MIVRRLTLNNFRRFRHLDLTDLPAGLIGIIGENGSGKSTILEAVGWALYGTYALTDRTNKEGVKTQGADADANCEVEIEFEMAGDTYKVVRRLQGKRAIAQAFVYKNGKDKAVAEREDGVNVYISKLFGMDRNTFFASVFARQKELDLLTSQDPAQRQQIIRRLLRIDLIDLAIKDIKQDCRQKKDLAGNLKGMITDITAINVEIEKLSEKEKSMVKQQKVNEEIFSNMKMELKSAKAKKQELESKRKAFQQVHTAFVRVEKEIQGKSEQSKKRSSELEELIIEKKELTKIEPKEDEYLSIKKTLEKFEEVRGLYEEKKGLEKDLNERLDDLAKVTEGKQKLTERLATYKGLADKKKKLQEKLKNEKASYKSISKEINILSAKIEACNVSIQQLEEKKKNIEKLGPKSKCPECSQDLGTNYERILEHFNEEMEKQSRIEKELDTRIEKEKAKAEATEEKIGEIESSLDNLHEDEKKESGIKSNIQVEEKRITALTGSAKKRKARISEIGAVEFSEEKYKGLKMKSKELVKFHERVMKLRTTTARIPILGKEIKALEEEVSELTKERMTKEKEQKDIGFNERELDAATESYEKLQSKTHDQEIAIEKIRHEIEMIKTEIARKKDMIKRQEEMQKKWKAAESDAKKLAVLNDLMDKFRQHLASRIRPMMIARTSQLVAGTTEGRYAAVDVDEEYNVYVYDGTESFPVKRFSGGEQDLVNLCLRVAISQIISEQNSRTGINFIALDEIFGSQDAGRKENILKALNNLSEQFRQIFLITHHEDLRDSMQHVLVVEETEEGVSTATFTS
ncbi:MAG: SMC family ATPase [Candidatus Omnitrophica bacterium]|nr:SMC family ATPase [Candidatus Omnitrophota bacterium]